MRMCNKALLALACTAALSACDGEKAANSIAKRLPLDLPEVGVHEANLLGRDKDGAPLKMIAGAEGFALVYPERNKEQRWGVWAEMEKNDTASQWLGKTGKDTDKDGIYPISVIRDSERGLTHSGSSESNYHLISFKEQEVVNLKGQTEKLRAFDFATNGLKFGDNTEIFAGWRGQISTRKLASLSIENGARWSEADYKGETDAMVGDIKTSNNSGALTVEIQFPYHGCTLVGTGTASAGLSALTFTGFADPKCNLNREMVGAGYIADKWLKGLKAAKNGEIAYSTVIKHPQTSKETLVIGFPEMNGFVLMADKQP
ncbi:hypothetical protein FT669_05535 [Aeromonas jandaei]|nr:hypothetical protein FT669_05535 [Aeromonas jandaei]